MPRRRSILWQVELPFGITQRYIFSALVIIQVFAGNIIFGYLAGANFTLIGVSRILYTSHDTSFKRISLFQQLINAFRVGVFGPGQTLQIS